MTVAGMAVDGGVLRCGGLRRCDPGRGRARAAHGAGPGRPRPGVGQPHQELRDHRRGARGAAALRQAAR